MTWEEACDDRSLQNLFYKIELNKWGYLEMRQIANRRGECMGQVAFLLQTLLEGKGVASMSCPIETVENTKVADVAWASLERRRANTSEVSWTHAPEICVDIFYPGSHWKEFMLRREWCLSAGTEEFWICDDHGHMQFFGVEGPLERSRLCPDFPVKVNSLTDAASGVATRRRTATVEGPSTRFRLAQDDRFLRNVIVVEPA